MSAPTVTERDAVLREREAFARGAGWRWTQVPSEVMDKVALGGDSYAMYEKAAAQQFPLPKVTRARVVQDPIFAGITWSVKDGIARPSRVLDPSLPVNLTRALMWANLLANPTEEVEE